LESLGLTLREKRKNLGLSLEQVSADLRIKLQFLEALETEEYELLPDPLYKKIFLKAYADYLGLNFEELLNKFSKKEKREEEDTEEVESLMESGQTKPQSYIQILILLGIILGLVSFLVFLKHKKAVTDFCETPPESKVEEIKTDSTTEILTSDKKEETKGLSPQSEEMILRLEGLDRTWGLVLGDEDTLFSGFINKGMKIECRARNQFNITLGRAWVVEGYLNGEKLKPFAPQGRSIFGRKLNRENYKEYLENSQGER
jgi:cytoskeleton protein RodZ